MGVFLLGMFLVVANGLTTGQFKGFWDVAYSKNFSTSSVLGQQRHGLMLVGEVIFVLIAAEWSSSSDDARSMFLALFLVLFVIWGMNNLPALTGILNTLQGK